ncbi:hypothetical protein MJO28_012453 [Puccinia striiformis f. sp. tritici]|uniref:Uncharacterized protein n=4 Tax=Puccinia striiformis TaxID=27350 RepID=A0A0L0VQC4_9BASI|nr:hypothetical protein MJO28_012453 [Puccinia striiformis f. sp. tritici]KAI7945577.1 hypothetical protein MJO29_011965 [Puccinia striiformis f. sp. tritici]KAI9605811.1 hypothetical protein H4Q26_004180 [Puccinia striiformis f. sp. tritici PST-130]KNF01468.1 hypothetical protein PSTG_05251 [Puccinia striiformis f. sp. tritici PST-78]POW17732.1 hypothetical protein PSTT_00422 [Puccinia striiformis]
MVSYLLLECGPKTQKRKICAMRQPYENKRTACFSTSDNSHAETDDQQQLRSSSSTTATQLSLSKRITSHIGDQYGQLPTGWESASETAVAPASSSPSNAVAADAASTAAVESGSGGGTSMIQGGSITAG